jgi:DNA-binding transcriptional ArsR family regulator
MDTDEDFPVHTIDEIEAFVDEWRAAQPLTARRARREKTHMRSELQDAIQDITHINLSLIAPASRALLRISADRADRYDTWIAVGMALSELGSIGYAMWNEWSRRSSKYDPTACAEKWPTFAPGDGLTLASLDAWANEDDPRDDPADGCGPDCPNRARVHDHAATIQQLTRENGELRAHNQFVTNAQSAPGVKSASLRDTVVELKKEIDRVPLEERQPDQFVRVRPALMASYANSSPSTISRHLKRLEDRGLIERRVDRTYDNEHDQWISETFVRPCVDLTDPTVLVIPSEHGGARRRCPECHSDKLVREVRIYCAECEATISQDVELVNAPTGQTTELQDAIQDSQPLPSTDDDSHYVLSCSASSNKIRTPGSDLSELQDASQDITYVPPPQKPPTPAHMIPINTHYRHLWPENQRPRGGSL